MRSLAGPAQGDRFTSRVALLSGVIAFAVFIGPGPNLGSSTALGSPPILWTGCDAADPSVRCSIPRGIAANSENGLVFVADQVHRRIVEFNARGTFVKTWGWDVVEGGGTGFEICIPASGDICKPGLKGSGAGQFSVPLGVAIDSIGNVYVVDDGNNRIEKFSPKGDFLLMFGGEVNKTKVEAAAPEAERNLCPVDPGDVCQAGTIGIGKGKFGEWAVGSFIAVGSSDKIYVGDVNRIQIFDTDGHYLNDLPLDPEGELKERTVQGLAVDAAGNLYIIYFNKDDVRKLTPGGKELAEPRFKVKLPSAVAVDATGDVYAFGPIFAEGGIPLDPIFKFDQGGKLLEKFGKSEFAGSTGLASNLCEGSQSPGNVYVSNSVEEPQASVRAYGTEPIGCSKARTLPASNVAEESATLNGTVNPKGEAVSECFFEFGTTEGYGQSFDCHPSAAEIGTGSVPAEVHADIGGLKEGTIYHFRLVAKVGGETETGTDETFKTLGPPLISDEHTVGATESEASLSALVNPEGFATECHFEYGTTTSYGQSTPAQAMGEDRSDHSAAVTLKGLAPGTAYHWRIVCTNSSGTSKGDDHVAFTYRTSTDDTECPNQIFRIAASAFLPDCRAYEMVSPVEKNGGNILLHARGTIQATPDGEKITYIALPSFGDEPNSYAANQYLASRGGEGWSNHGIHPPVVGHSAVQNIQILGVIDDFLAFTPDLCSAWMFDYLTPPLTPEGQDGYANLYRRDNCEPEEGDLEALTPNSRPLPAETLYNYVFTTSVQGVSDDGHHAIFVSKAQINDEAATGQISQIYDRFGGGLHLVSVLPNGSASKTNNGVGSGYAFNLGNAVSRDGSRVYWVSNSLPEGGAGKIYVREHPEQGIVSGECAKATKACTVAVSSGDKAFFWAAAADGSKALYSEGSLASGAASLYKFDLTAKASSTLIAKNVKGVLGASQDLSRVYFVSSDNLTGAQQNGAGDEAQGGKPNLYLAEGGALTYVATLIGGDVGLQEPGTNLNPYDLTEEEARLRTVRVSASGARLAFQSRAPLTDYDNTDAENGKADVEVFVYEAGGEILCVSCNPSGGRPQSRELRTPSPYWATDPSNSTTGVFAAAWIPGRERPLHASNVLSADGGRLFFNSNDALVPRDTDGTMDVYEWEELGKGRCQGADPNYFPQNGGCLYLISAGESPFESEFWEATPDGNSVFFTTESSLLPQDPGLVDLYDARVEGGFPQPIGKAICEGEACQSPPPPPAYPTPSSSTYNGPGNLRQKRHRCPKGRRRVRSHGKVRCLKRKKRVKRDSRQRAGQDRRAAR